MGSGVRLLAFAGARDILGQPEVEFALAAPCTTQELMDLVCEQYPGLVPYRGCLRLAVNGVYADRADPVREGDEVAIIPPVAGG